MSVDERLEALTHSVELLAGMQIETEKRMATLIEQSTRLQTGSKSWKGINHGSPPRQPTNWKLGN